ncbi:WD40 repeat domain-containing protein [Nostoc sp. FACHB-892]|uniref:WD40 repeat domain-containing protein n=1 Tax=Nostoc sp. FACHB-892 TaxID=2692843 RepID=UPI0016880E64|nr:WD40 repeat domain-containing protein [Nostoc sp. FACHB-892]MBD2728807.1 WD40 repeat domain-containing protein [Nostoc sp. FACHB-892]
MHDLKFEQKDYQQAFQLKQKQREIESQYGFRAFIGAGRLQPRRQAINPANSPNQPSKDIFGEVVAAFGRQQDIKSLLHRIGRTDCKLTVIYGQSGVGKSSIVQAGLLPVLQLTSFDGLETLPILVQVYTAWEKECGRLLVEKLEDVRGVRLSAPVETSAAIIEQLQQNENRNLVTVLIFDQFEEFFFAYKDQASRRNFYDFLRDCLNISYVKVILSLRQDYLHYLLEWSRTTELPIIDNDILDKNILYYLGNFSPSVAKSVIQSFTKNSQFSLAPDLIDALVEDLASELREVRPIELQVIGAQLQTEKITTLEQYRKHWLKEKLVERFLEEVVKDCGLENERAAQLVLYLLTNENNTRPLKTRAELVKDLATESQNLDLVLEILVGSGLVFRVLETPADRYQLVHDYLVPFIRQQRSAELLAKIKEAEEEKQRMQAELNRVLQKQLKDARRTGIGLAGLAALASGFAIASLLAFIDGKNSQLNALSAVSDGRLAANQDMQALIEGIRAAKQVNFLNRWNIGIIQDRTKQQVLAALQSASYGIREINTLEGHSATVNTISFSPNSKLIASGSDDKTIRLWKSDGSAAISKPIEQKVSVTSLSFSPDSQRFASGTQNGIVRLWNINGELIKEFTNFQAKKINTTTSFDSKKITSGSGNTSQQQQNIEIKSSTNLQDKERSITSVTFSQDGQTIATVSEDKSIKIWKINGTLLHNLEGYSSRTRSMSLSPNGQSIVILDDDNTVKFLQQNGKLINTIQGRGSSLIKMDFSHNREILAIRNINYGKNKIHLWKTDGAFFSIIQANKNENIKNIVFSSDNKAIAVQFKNYIQVWRFDGTLFQTIDTSNNISRQKDEDLFNIVFSSDNQTIGLEYQSYIQVFKRNGVLIQTIDALDSIRTVDSQIVVTFSTENRLRFWHNGKLIRAIPIKKESNNNDKLFSDGKNLAIIKGENEVELWTTDSKPSKKSLNLRQHLSINRISNINFIPNSDILAIEGDNDVVKLWKIQKGEEATKLLDTFKVDPIKRHSNQITSVSISPDGNIIASASKDKTVKLWQRNGQLIKTITSHKEIVNSVTFSSDIKTIASASDDQTIKLWKYDGSPIQTKTPLEHPAKVNRVIFSPDGQIIASASDDKTVKLWQLDGTPIKTFNESHPVTGISFSHDGKIISSATSQTVKLWSLDGTLIATYQRLGTGDVSFSQNGKWIAAAGNDVVALWDLNLDVLLERSCIFVWDYLNRNKDEKNSDRKLCDDIPKSK